MDGSGRSRMCSGALLPLALTLLGCASTLPPPSVRVTQGGELVAPAAASMRTLGVVFAPYSEFPLLGAELTHEHYKCIEAVNQAVLVALASRFAIRPVHARPARSRIPAWARGADGPRVAVHVEAFRCGLVVGDTSYSSVASDDPGGAESLHGEVVLVMHDRSTGEARIGVRADALGADGLTAAQSAAESAVRALAPGE